MMKLTNKEWVNLISENFGVSRSVAKEMLHNMLNTPKYKKYKDKEILYGNFTGSQDDDSGWDGE